MTSFQVGLSALFAVVALAIGGVLLGPWGKTAASVEAIDARPVTWSDLLPDGDRATWGDVARLGPTSEAEWLEQEAARGADPTYMTLTGPGAVWAEQPMAGVPAPTRPDLDGVRVALSGYMTPLSFEERETRLFLLVPYVGACIHVPAPPANQIVIVESVEPVPVLDMWQPFTAVGDLRIEHLDTGLAESAYVMTLDRMVSLEVAGGPEEDYTADEFGNTVMQ